ncbi:MAG: glycosyltransferase, partial [Bacteroidota bacterium]|nr:glycosyltransferase [Bacteroidota bacterium]MDX5430823.1 glycosyltransferase [Bacteroidota bacterium]MDX5469567.1 glycosyltransferase [Bacteroidota bacterium]
TIIIPFRNEAQNLPSLLTALDKQSYQHAVFLFVDDHSTDGGAEIIQAWRPQFGERKLLRLSEDQSGKKMAVRNGVREANTEWILFTDADTVPSPDWIASMMAMGREQGVNFVSGPVSFTGGKSWFERWQILEFSGLIALGAAAIGIKKPTMCNGANLMYRKSIFEEVGGFEGNLKVASGDDQFMMHRVHEKYPDSIRFCKNPAAIVFTAPQAGLSEFLNQRVRWASKNGQFERKSVSYEMIGVWFLSFILIAGLIGGIVDSRVYPFLLMAFVMKMGIEYLFYAKVLNFFQQERRIRFFLFSEIFQIFYVFCIGILGKFVGYQWKERTHR